MRTFKYLDLITASFVAVLLISNIASTKILDLRWFTFDGGTILFPLAYIFGDVLTEVYGYARSRRVIWIGFFWIAVAAAVFWLVDELPAAGEYEHTEAFHAILGQTPRIVLASLVAFLVGEFVNSVILAKMKVRTDGRALWSRAIGSTIFGQAIDTAVFLAIAFGGVFTTATMIDIFRSNYIFKVGVELAFVPITYLIVNYLKKSEGVDAFDRHTDFNPFNLSTSNTPAD